MSGFLIDGNDAFTAYGVRLLEGSLASVVAMPPLKQSSILTTAWHEADGIDADLSQPRLDTRQVSLLLATDGTRAMFDSLIQAITDGAYHTYSFTDIGRTLSLRLTGLDDYEQGGRLGFVTLRLADDNPLGGYTYTQPSSTSGGSEDYSLDGRPLSDYGVRLLGGTLDTISAHGSPRANLSRSLSVQGGTSYDGEAVHFDARSAKIPCLLRAKSTTELWKNWDALAFDLSRAGKRTLTVEGENAVQHFYYVACDVDEFVPDTTDYWLRFSLTIQLLDSRLTDITNDNEQ